MFGTTFEYCLYSLSKFLKHYMETNLILSKEKSHFMVQEEIILGHFISEKEIEVDKAKIEIITSKAQM